MKKDEVLEAISKGWYSHVDTGEAPDPDLVEAIAVEIMGLMDIYEHVPIPTELKMKPRPGFRTPLHDKVIGCLGSLEFASEESFFDIPFIAEIASSGSFSFFYIDEWVLYYNDVTGKTHEVSGIRSNSYLPISVYIKEKDKSLSKKTEVPA